MGIVQLCLNKTIIKIIIKKKKTPKNQTFLRSSRLNPETELTEGKEIASTLPKSLQFNSVKEKQ